MRAEIHLSHQHFEFVFGNFSKSSKGPVDLERIEAEYIKNLQQQVYFLELEANYLVCECVDTS